MKGDYILAAVYLLDGAEAGCCLHTDNGCLTAADLR